MNDKSTFRIFSGVFLLFTLFIASCKKDANDPVEVLQSDKQIKSFGFNISKNPSLPGDMICEIKGDTIFALAAAGTDISQLVPEFTFDGVDVVVANVSQTSNASANDFRGLVQYTVVAEDKSQKIYTVKFTDNGVPALFINTVNAASIDSKEVYVAGTVKLLSNFREVLYDGKMEVKGRGNSTWGMAKKPYRIKLDKKASLLGMTEGRNWVLLANYADKSLMRNELAFRMSRSVGLAFTPESRYVDVFLNGSYQGNYLMTEQVKEGKDLVDVEYDGGYLLEVDGFAGSEPVHFYTHKSMPITVKYPGDDEISAGQKDYIKQHFQKFEDALFASDFDHPLNGYRKYFDIDSYVNYYITNEVLGNPDMFWSTYMYKKPNDDKIYSGPVWDFDIAINNDDRLGDQVNGLMFTAAHEPKTWIRRMMEDRTFRQKIRSRWNELKPKILTLPNDATLLAKQLALSQRQNFLKWPILGTKVYREFQIAGSFNAEVMYVKNHLTDHINWLDAKFNSVDYQ